MGNRALIKDSIRGVGRIEVSNHPRRSWIGTGFIVEGHDGSHIVITNRHVAIEIANRGSDGTYDFITGLLPDKPMRALLDLKEEAISEPFDASATLPISEVIHIEDAKGPDFAFLRLKETSDSARFQPLQLDHSDGRSAAVAAIGYPAKDTRQTDLDIVLRLLGDVYNKKRLSPGIIKSTNDIEVRHDCSTLGGNSGSPLINLRTGDVLALHAGGFFPNSMNYAVPSHYLAKQLQSLTRSRATPERYRSSEPEPPAAPIAVAAPTLPKSAVATLEVPLRIHFELGAPTAATIAGPGLSQGQTMSIEQTLSKAQQQFGRLAGAFTSSRGLLMKS